MPQTADLDLSLDEGPPYEGTASQVCPEGKALEISVYQSKEKHETGTTLCQLAVSGEEPGTVDYENQAGTPEDVIAETNLTELEYTRTGSSLCGSESGSATSAGGWTVSAEDVEGTPLRLMAG